MTIFCFLWGVCALLVAQFGDGVVGELVGHFVAGVAGVAFDPLPVDGVAARKLVEFLPEVAVLHWFFLRGFPAVFFPLVNPAGDAVFDVVGVGGDAQGVRAFDGFEGFYDGGEFHAVVGGVGFGAAEGFFVAAVAHEDAPAADAGVAFAGTVGVDVDVVSCVGQCFVP